MEDDNQANIHSQLQQYREEQKRRHEQVSHEISTPSSQENTAQAPKQFPSEGHLLGSPSITPIPISSQPSAPPVTQMEQSASSSTQSTSLYPRLDTKVPPSFLSRTLYFLVIVCSVPFSCSELTV